MAEQPLVARCARRQRIHELVAIRTARRDRFAWLLRAVAIAFAMNAAIVAAYERARPSRTALAPSAVP